MLTAKHFVTLLSWLFMLVNVIDTANAATVHIDPSTLPDDYYLLTSPPFSGHANNLIQLGSELRSRGYNVVMAMNADEQTLKARILREDIDYYDLGDKPYSRYMIDGANSGRADGHNPFPIIKFMADILSTISLGMYKDLEVVVKAKPPRVLIFEEFVMYGGHLAHKYDLPGVLIAPHSDPMIVPLLDTCPLNSPHFTRSLDPGFFERVLNVLLRIILRRFAAIYFGPLTQSDCAEIGVPKELCFPLKNHVPEYGLLAIAPTGYPMSVCDIPDYFKRVGQFVRPNMVKGLDQETWFQQREAEGADVIYFATGSDTIIHQSQVEALLAGIDMVRRIRGKPLYVYYARGQDVLDRYSEIKAQEHPFVYFAEYAPQHWILNHTLTKLFISHCGAGGVIEACYFGVPVYAIPFGRDQPSLASAIEAAGMAIVADTYNLKVEKVAEEIQTLLEDETYTEKAKHMARIGQNSGGAGEAADLIDRYIAVGSNEHLVSFDNRWPWWKTSSLDVLLFLAMVLLGIATLVLKMAARGGVSVTKKKCHVD